MSEYLDASVVVKWFKEDELDRINAVSLKERIIENESEFFMSRFGLLEVVRALVKAVFQREKIDECAGLIDQLYQLEALKGIPLNDVVGLAKEFEVELNLYAGDAIHLASGVTAGCEIFWSADKHHLKDKTRRYLSRFGMEISSLDDLQRL